MIRQQTNIKKNRLALWRWHREQTMRREWSDTHFLVVHGKANSWLVKICRLSCWYWNRVFMVPLPPLSLFLTHKHTHTNVCHFACLSLHQNQVSSSGSMKNTIFANLLSCCHTRPIEWAILPVHKHEINIGLMCVVQLPISVYKLSKLFNGSSIEFNDIQL